MNNQEQTPRTLPNSLTELGREARCAARDTGTLRAWWRRAIGDVRDLLTAAKHGEDVEENLDMAYAILEHLRFIVADRVRHACSCEGSQALKKSLSLLSQGLHGAMMDILLAAVLAEGDLGTGSPLKGQITSALRQVPTLAEVRRLASELGNFQWTGDIPMPMVRQGAPTRCQFCGSSR